MTEEGRAVLRAEGLRKGYGEGPGRVEVLRGIELQVRPGEGVAVTGPSGSGKSTLLALLGGLDRADAGKVLLAGRDLSRLDDRALARVRALEVGFVFQLHHLLPHCTVLENTLVPTLLTGEPFEAARERALALLGRVGLSHRLGHRPGQLSGGERQRAAVARALVNRPALLLADEPTGSLDQAAAGGLIDLFGELHRKEGVTLVVATHSPLLASRMDRVLALRDGELRPAPGAPATGLLPVTP